MIIKKFNGIFMCRAQRMIDFPLFFRYNLLLYVYKKN